MQRLLQQKRIPLKRLISFYYWNPIVALDMTSNVLYGGKKGTAGFPVDFNSMQFENMQPLCGTCLL